MDASLENSYTYLSVKGLNIFRRFCALKNYCYFIYLSSLQVKNRGPDQVPLTEIEIQWPYEAPSGKHLLYLIDVKVRGSFNAMKRKTRCKGLGSFSRIYIKTR